MASQTRAKSRQRGKRAEKQEEVTGLIKVDDDESQSENESQSESESESLLIQLEKILDVKLEVLKEGLATKECISSLRDTILKQAEIIDKLEARVVLLESYVKQVEKNEREVKHLSEDYLGHDSKIDQLERKCDDMEQYQRRLCLRINGVECEDDETAEDCLEKVKSIIKKDLEVNIPETAFDRAHRIGNIHQDSTSGKKYKPIIVKFTTWRQRTMVFRARKKTRKVRVSMDLTKKRIKLLEKANDMLVGVENCFAMADVNCRLHVKLDDGFHAFETETDLMELIKYV